LKKTETAQFLAVVKTAYPAFEITAASTRLWHELLIELDYEVAKNRLQEHIRSNRYPPTIADIVRHDPNQFVDYERMKEETAQRFKEMDEWEQQAIPLPEHLMPKLLRGGEGI
jgi:hypothetical protein